LLPTRAAVNRPQRKEQNGQSATRRFVKKIAQFCPSVAQNGASVNKKNAQRNFWSKLGNLKTKSNPNVELI
jgi:hypothetical protein